MSVQGDAGRRESLRGAWEYRLRRADISRRLPNDLPGYVIKPALLDQAGIECSAGSACMAGKIRPSHVQLAMGLDGARGRGSLRFSFSILNTMEDARKGADIVTKAVLRLRQAKHSGENIGVSPGCCLANS